MGGMKHGKSLVHLNTYAWFCSTAAGAGSTTNEHTPMPMPHAGKSQRHHGMQGSRSHHLRLCSSPRCSICLAPDGHSCRGVAGCVARGLCSRNSLTRH